MAAAKRRFGRVRKLPSGRWQARYRGPDGIDRPAPETFATKRDADRWLTLAEAEIARGKWVDPEVRLTEPAPKVKTRATYASLLKTTVLPRFGELPVAAAGRSWSGSGSLR